MLNQTYHLSQSCFSPFAGVQCRAVEWLLLLLHCRLAVAIPVLAQVNLPTRVVRGLTPISNDNEFLIKLQQSELN